MSDFIGMARACSFHGREIFNLTSISCLGYLSLLSTWSHFVASVSRAIADQLWTHLPCRSLSVLLRSVVHGDIIVLCDLTLKTFPDLEIISCIYTFGKSFNSKVVVSRDREGGFCHQLLSIMSFQTHKNCVHNKGIFNET